MNGADDARPLQQAAIGRVRRCRAREARRRRRDVGRDGRVVADWRIRPTSRRRSGGSWKLALSTWPAPLGPWLPRSSPWPEAKRVRALRHSGIAEPVEGGLGLAVDPLGRLGATEAPASHLRPGEPASSTPLQGGPLPAVSCSRGRGMWPASGKLRHRGDAQPVRGSRLRSVAAFRPREADDRREGGLRRRRTAFRVLLSLGKTGAAPRSIRGSRSVLPEALRKRLGLPSIGGPT